MTLSKFIAQYPIPSVVIAASAGFALGFIIASL